MGSVIGIYIGKNREPLRSEQSASAVVGRGLDGDRYFAKEGTFSKKEGADREVTLIEGEAIDSLNRDYGVELSAGEARRNLVTRGVALNHLIGSEFSVGEVVLEGLRLCEQCGHLAKLTSERAREGLVHRGGLRARIVRGGMIRVGDEVKINGEGGNRGT